MREIKFRAWDKKDKEMFRVISIHFVYEHSKSKQIIVSGRGGSIKNPILMQFTGLKDKNGQEIYVGDIIKWEFPFLSNKTIKDYGKVIWKFNAFMVTGIEEPMFLYRLCNMEVIGNIYENKELLEVGG